MVQTQNTAKLIDATLLERLDEAMNCYGASDAIAELSRFCNQYFNLLADIQNGYGLKTRNEVEDAGSVLQELRECTILSAYEISNITFLVYAISEVIAAAEPICECYKKMK
ncbi:hypothetical protein [uncultured Alistipes sp.]|uniref:hypothetical protein n=1 Tax=uncultured Alistipes sp. TaxID=538949 RepID=UPI0026DFE0E6|nr:hypothetical protein [uncultured Alistipes sp.]